MSSHPPRPLFQILVATALAVCAFAGAPSEAAATEVQTLGPIKWPGHFQVGFHPLGGQVGLAAPTTVGFYKSTLDLSYLVKEYPGGLGLWVGGGFNYAVSPALPYGVATFGPGGTVIVPTTAFHDLQVHAFAMLTFNMLAYALVPFVRAGGAGDILLVGGTTGGGGGFRFGGGIHYWLLKNLGLGVEMNFLLGGAGGNLTGFYGTWDFGLGARFAF